MTDLLDPLNVFDNQTSQKLGEAVQELIEAGFEVKIHAGFWGSWIEVKQHKGAK